MIYRTPQEKIKEYYERMGINQSALKVILKKGVEAFIHDMQEILKAEEHYYEDKEHFIVGKGVDCLITEGEDAFKQQFHYNELLKKPPEKPMTIVRMVYDWLADHPVKNPQFSVYKEAIYNAMNTVKLSTDKEAGYYMNRAKPYAEDTRMETLMKDGLCQLYWEDLLKASGKQILTKEQNDVIYNIYMSLISHPHTSYLFHPLEYQNEHMDIIYQLPLYWTERVELSAIGEDTIEEDCKCLIDVIIINHDKHTIVPIDVKTTGGFITRFNEVVSYRRYDVQAAFYTWAIDQNKHRLGEVVGRDIAAYTIENFAFVVESTQYPGTPLIFAINDDLIGVGTDGNMDGTKEGWTQALEVYARFKKANFSVKELLAEKNGIVWIDDEFKTDLDI